MGIVVNEVIRVGHGSQGLSFVPFLRARLLARDFS
jgi:hypothetical protein